MKRLAMALVLLCVAAPALAGRGGGWGGGRSGGAAPWAGYRNLRAPLILDDTPTLYHGYWDERHPSPEFYFKPGDPRSCVMGWTSQLRAEDRAGWVDADKYGMPGWRCPVQGGKEIPMPSGPCLCGDPYCPSCGPAQGMTQPAGPVCQQCDGILELDVTRPGALEAVAMADGALYCPDCYDESIPVEMRR